MKQKRVKQIVEALLFASNRSLTVAQIKEVLEEVEPSVIKTAINELSGEYKSLERSFNIGEVAGRSEERRGGKECRSRWSPDD